ncbi:MAG: (p)ppGpp synthetase [Chloroflexi bacterium]|jgi:guanosine-3',5'-bis(diphosphate) 3'-pyrophosphohydrolase|nr:(p)ppGpp synthetase [Chloroflexota bacterium]
MQEITTGMNRIKFEEILTRYFIPSQIQLIMMAYRFSKYGHHGQSREGGGRYFEHPRQAALILLEQGVFDHEIIIAALLHDVMEDSFILTWTDLEFIFGSRICAIVKVLTKEPGLPKEQYIPRLLGALPEAQVVKLADRLHNLTTLGACNRDKQVKQIKETRGKIYLICDKLALNPRYTDLANWFKEQMETRCREYE